AKTTAVSGPGARSICRAAAVRSRASSPPARAAAARISASPSWSSLVRSCPAAWRLARSASQERYGSAIASMVKTHRPTLERRGERVEHGARLGVSAPELEELVLCGPVAVRQRERTRAPDQGHRRGDALGRGGRCHPFERALDRATHREAHGPKVELDAERLRLRRNPEDALGDG